MHHHRQPGPAPGIRLYSPGGQATTTDDRNTAEKIAIERAYVLEWADNADSSKFTQRRLDSAEEMRSSMEEQRPETETGHRRLFVLHGLPTDLLEVLRDLLDIDPYFIDAHARRQSYRPLRRGDAHMGYTHFDYPELVDCDPDLMMSYVSQVDDLMGDPIAYRLSKYGDTAAMFCRGSLWTNSKLDVLLLDRPLWRNPSSRIYKARYSSKITKSVLGPKNGGGIKLAAGDDIPSLEMLLIDLLRGPQPASSNDTMQLLEQIALRQWSEFFEALALEPPPPSSEDDLTVLYWQTHQSLERNLESSMLGGQQKASQPQPPTDWERLLARLERQTRISSLLTPPRIATKIELPPHVTTRRNLTRGDGEAADDYDDDYDYNTHHQQQQHMNSPEENQRSLDRVTYLGGVLLPISVVSGILSMNDDFSPGGDLFFVFWAVAMPLCLVTLLVIYADSIRKIEVWMEVAASHQSDETNNNNNTTSSSSSSSNEDIELPPTQDPYALDVDVDLDEEARLASAAVPMPVSMAMASRRRTTRMRQQRGRGDECTGMPAAPGIIAEHSFSSSGGKSGSGLGQQQQKRWKKQQLGWMGACKSIFRIYKLRQLQMQSPEPGPGPGPGPGLRPPAASRRRDTRSL